MIADSCQREHQLGSVSQLDVPTDLHGVQGLSDNRFRRHVAFDLFHRNKPSIKT